MVVPDIFTGNSSQTEEYCVKYYALASPEISIYGFKKTDDSF
ncbi:MAG: hypothetical protein ACXWFB_12715 [Nitrososphaeraceae archaeon]